MSRSSTLWSHSFNLSRGPSALFLPFPLSPFLSSQECWHIKPVWEVDHTFLWAEVLWGNKGDVGVWLTKHKCTHRHTHMQIHSHLIHSTSQKPAAALSEELIIIQHIVRTYTLPVASSFESPAFPSLHQVESSFNHLKQLKWSLRVYTFFKVRFFSSNCLHLSLKTPSVNRHHPV